MKCPGAVELKELPRINELFSPDLPKGRPELPLSHAQLICRRREPGPGCFSSEPGGHVPHNYIRCWAERDLEG